MHISKRKVKVEYCFGSRAKWWTILNFKWESTDIGAEFSNRLLICRTLWLDRLFPYSLWAAPGGLSCTTHTTGSTRVQTEQSPLSSSWLLSPLRLTGSTLVGAVLFFWISRSWPSQALNTGAVSDPWVTDQRDCVTFGRKWLLLKHRDQAAHEDTCLSCDWGNQRWEDHRGQADWSSKTTRKTDRRAGPWEEGLDGEQSTVRTGTAGQVFSDDSYHGQAA